MIDLTQVDRKFAKNKTSYAVIRIILLKGDW